MALHTSREFQFEQHRQHVGRGNPALPDQFVDLDGLRPELFFYPGAGGLGAFRVDHWGGGRFADDGFLERMADDRTQD